MPQILYVPHKFQKHTAQLIEQSIEIILENEAEGDELTLRQLYYQLVAAGIIPNNQQSYDRLGAVINDARLAGLIDWDHIQDRTRAMHEVAHWDNPTDILDAVARSFRLDKWATQPHYVQCWVEKEALAAVVARACTRLDIPYFACRGYVSQSEMWVAAQRLIRRINRGVEVHILHLGDHDPSGLDMTRDIFDRLQLFCAAALARQDMDLDVRRIALNMSQVQQYNLPPNPAKLTDGRVAAYIAEYGPSSWELDALRNSVIRQLITDAVDGLRDDELYNVQKEQERVWRSALRQAAGNWDEVAEWVASEYGEAVVEDEGDEDE